MWARELDFQVGKEVKVRFWSVNLIRVRCYWIVVISACGRGVRG